MLIPGQISLAMQRQFLIPYTSTYTKYGETENQNFYKLPGKFVTNTDLYVCFLWQAFAKSLKMKWHIY